MIQLLEELETVNRELIDKKYDYELKKVELWLNTDFSTILNKAKPTQKDKEAYIKQQTIADKRNVKLLEANLEHLKRIFKVKCLNNQTIGEAL